MSNDPRSVTIASIGVRFGTPEDVVFPVIEDEARRAPDLIVLPEVWISQAERAPGSLNDPQIARARSIARTYSVNIVYPLDRMEDEKRRNSALFIARNGDIIAAYDKIYPYWAELSLPRPVDPGEHVTVVDADFGRVGLAICFDVNFPNVWEEFDDRDVELVLWTSAYSSGSSLTAHALNHHFPIVTATQQPDTAVVDITGQETFHHSGEGISVSRVVVDLDRCIFHENFNLEKRDRLLAEHGDEIEMESWLRREQWFVLRSRKPGVSARDLAKAYGLEELRHYKRRSRVEIDRIRASEIR